MFVGERERIESDGLGSRLRIGRVVTRTWPSSRIDDRPHRQRRQRHGASEALQPVEVGASRAVVGGTHASSQQSLAIRAGTSAGVSSSATAFREGFGRESSDLCCIPRAGRWRRFRARAGRDRRRRWLPTHGTHRIREGDRSAAPRERRRCHDASCSDEPTSETQAESIVLVTYVLGTDLDADDTSHLAPVKRAYEAEDGVKVYEFSIRQIRGGLRGPELRARRSELGRTTRIYLMSIPRRGRNAAVEYTAVGLDVARSDAVWEEVLGGLRSSFGAPDPFASSASSKSPASRAGRIIGIVFLGSCSSASFRDGARGTSPGDGRKPLVNVRSVDWIARRRWIRPSLPPECPAHSTHPLTVGQFALVVGPRRAESNDRQRARGESGTSRPARSLFARAGRLGVRSVHNDP